MDPQVIAAASRLLRESIAELEEPAARVAGPIETIELAARLLRACVLVRWCRIQFGDQQLIDPITRYVDLLLSGGDYPGEAAAEAAAAELAEADVVLGRELTIEEIRIKASRAGGGWESIGRIEAAYDALLASADGSHGIYNATSLTRTIEFVRREAHRRAVELYYSDPPNESAPECEDLEEGGDPTDPQSASSEE